VKPTHFIKGLWDITYLEMILQEYITIHHFKAIESSQTLRSFGNVLMLKTLFDF